MMNGCGDFPRFTPTMAHLGLHSLGVSRVETVSFSGLARSGTLSETVLRFDAGTTGRSAIVDHVSGCGATVLSRVNGEIDLLVLRAHDGSRTLFQLGRAAVVVLHASTRPGPMPS
jgi:hypothetical protein